MSGSLGTLGSGSDVCLRVWPWGLGWERARDSEKGLGGGLSQEYVAPPHGFKRAICHFHTPSPSGLSWPDPWGQGLPCRGRGGGEQKQEGGVAGGEVVGLPGPRREADRPTVYPFLHISQPASQPACLAATLGGYWQDSTGGWSGCVGRGKKIK